MAAQGASGRPRVRPHAIPNWSEDRHTIPALVVCQLSGIPLSALDKTIAAGQLPEPLKGYPRRWRRLEVMAALRKPA
jgi:hypothetical protein